MQEGYDSEDEREIEGKLIIVDEMSMVDTWLAHQLIESIPDHIQVIFVGDEDQLPSVGPGQVLKDLLHSERHSNSSIDRYLSTGGRLIHH